MRYTIRYTILWAAVALSAIAGAETAQAKIDALNALPNVLQANFARAPQSIPFFGELYTATIGWYYTTNGVAENSSAEVVIVALGTPQEAAYWLTKTPTILQPVVETKYLTTRTAGGWAGLTGAQQKAGIQNFCNKVYKDAANVDGNIREFDVQPVDGTTIKVSGYFDLGTTWEHQTWFVRLIDPQGSVSAPYSNVEFQRIVEETTVQ